MDSLWTQYFARKKLIPLDEHIKNFIWEHLQDRKEIQILEIRNNEPKTIEPHSISFEDVQQRENKFLLKATESTRNLALGLTVST